MRHTKNFHPEWGCVAPAPSFLRTVRTVLVATAVGGTAGAGVVLSLVDHSAGETSVAERTLVRQMPTMSTPPRAPQPAQLNAQTVSQGESAEERADGQVEESATNELNASRSVRQAVVTTSAEVRATDDTYVQTAVSLSPTVQIRQKRVVERARHASRQPQHSPAPQTAPNAIQRFLTGLTVVIEHGWSSPRSPANRTSRAHGKNPPATIS
jgi:hypothetical protein